MKNDLRILSFLYDRKNDGKYYDVSKHIKFKVSKREIDDYVIDLEENGYLSKKYPGRMQKSMIRPGDDLSPSNNSICKITSKGIDYVENEKRFNYNSKLTWFGIGISFIALCMSIVALFLR